MCPVQFFVDVDPKVLVWVWSACNTSTCISNEKTARFAWQTSSGFIRLLSVDSSHSLCVRTTSDLTGLHKFTENLKWISQTEEDREVKLSQSSLSDGEHRSPQHPVVQHASFIWVLPLAPSPVRQTVYESGQNGLSKVKLRLTVERDSWSCLTNCFLFLFLSILQEALISLWEMREGQGLKITEFKCQSSTKRFLSSHSMFRADDTTAWNQFWGVHIWVLWDIFLLKHIMCSSLTCGL